MVDLNLIVHTLKTCLIQLVLKELPDRLLKETLLDRHQSRHRDKLLSKHQQKGNKVPHLWET